MPSWLTRRQVIPALPYGGLAALALWVVDLRVDLRALHDRDELFQQRFDALDMEIKRIRYDPGAVQPAAQTLERLGCLEAIVKDCKRN